MEIPRSKLERFAAELIEACLVSRTERIHRGMTYRNIFLTGDESGDAQVFNKTYAYIDDLESLLYSPVSLRPSVQFYGSPGPTDRAKGRAVASDLHSRLRQSNTDTRISDAVLWSLINGKAHIKLLWDRDGFSPHLVQSASMGVLQEHLTQLDENMEAFVHSSYISIHQFKRMIWNRSESDKTELMRKARRYTKPSNGASPIDENAMKQITIGGLYPFQAQGSSTPNNTRGIVDWMRGPSPQLAPRVMEELMRLDELWVWNDAMKDWATFQMIGSDLMIFGREFIANLFARNPASGDTVDSLKGHHPFNEFCPNRLDNYYWGRSEIDNIAILQMALNSRINGINGILRRQEDPPKKFTGTTGVNQIVLSRLSRPGGYFSDPNPNAKVEDMAPQLNQNMFESLHEYERMFDEMGGLPPIAKGRGEAGVRSQAHAETLVRMFSPRFKDRALLVERDVDGLLGLSLDMCKAFVGDKLTAYTPKADAGIEGEPGSSDPLQPPPSPNLVPIEFLYSNLAENTRVTVDSHSSSPAFQMEARSLVFDLVKLGGMSIEEAVQHIDAPDPEALIADIERRKAEQAALIAQHPELLDKGGKGGKKK